MSIFSVPSFLPDSRFPIPDSLSASLSFSHLESQNDVAELKAIAVVKLAVAGNGLIVNAGLLGRRLVVHQHKPVMRPADEGMALFHFHAPAQGDATVFLAACPRPCLAV